MSHGIVGPGEEGRLDAVDGARPVVGCELACCRHIRDEEKDADADCRNGYVVPGYPSFAEDIGAQSPQERAYDPDCLETGREVIEVAYGV